MNSWVQQIAVRFSHGSLFFQRNRKVVLPIQCASDQLTSGVSILIFTLDFF